MFNTLISVRSFLAKDVRQIRHFVLKIFFTSVKDAAVSKMKKIDKRSLTVVSDRPIGLLRSLSWIMTAQRVFVTAAAAAADDDDDDNDGDGCDGIGCLAGN